MAPRALNDARDDNGDIVLWTSDDGILWGEGRVIVPYVDLPAVGPKTPTSAYRCSMTIADGGNVLLWVSYKASATSARPPREIWRSVTYRIVLYQAELPSTTRSRSDRTRRYLGGKVVA